MSALNIGSRALSANLAALQVIGNNIANVNTPGYSRQNVLLQTSGYQQMGNGFFGKGMEIATVERSHNQYLTIEAQKAGSVAAADALRYARLQQLESAFPTGAAGLGAALNEMLNAWTDVSSSPGNLTARTVAIAKGEELASRLRNTAGQLDSLQKTTLAQAEGSVSTINALAKDLAKINGKISEIGGGGAHTPNDLLDQRDKILADLNKQVQTTSIQADDGTVSVFVAGSQPLVLGARANELAVGRDSTDTARLALSFVQGGVKTAVPESSLGGGELAGLMRFMNSDLVDVQNQLGRMALATAYTVNRQHQLGVDLQGNPGGNFFVPPAAAKGLPMVGNNGSAEVSATVADPTALVASDYELRFETGGMSVVRLSDGTSTPVTSLPAQVDGLTFNLDSGVGQPGDRILIRPYEAAARNLQVAIGSPDKLAAASPVMVTPGAGNSGGLSVESLYASSASANLTDPVTITFLADGSFTATGLGPGNPAPDNPGPPPSYNFKPGESITLNGWSLTLRGNPGTGDTFSIGAAPPGSVAQNAGNATGMLALRDMPTFDGVSLSDGYVTLFADIGTRVQGAEFAASFSANVATTAETARANVAGVNLDEEAARLLQFQQAYQASAKFLQIAQSTFDNLLQIVGR
ncbi:flagellar hook-associated protein FlgK [Hydrogenophaga sp. BPS33]|uniref:flagellar hook-associated protein FlgK n=1 Tax=Hydrogenophaga sp. BPS33 TaxID=2651974 RepID=UPI0013203865|nr:flagellar hook-associated protein FlgK [Hydrogenophaga sp. BPS33]QHE88063.1 flagellar hook-associated protein FlgK [Hydrogenophaga sp. BPS33]